MQLKEMARSSIRRDLLKATKEAVLQLYGCTDDMPEDDDERPFSADGTFTPEVAEEYLEGMLTSLHS